MSTDKLNEICAFGGIPLKAYLLNCDGEYVICLEKYGNRHRGMTIKLTEEQIKNIRWWY